MSTFTNPTVETTLGLTALLELWASTLDVQGSERVPDGVLLDAAVGLFAFSRSLSAHLDALPSAPDNSPAAQALDGVLR